MTDKERLEELIRNISFVVRSYEGVEPLIQYAKEQAEHVKELEEECAGWKEASRFNDDKLEKQNKHYREALEEANKELINLYNNLLDHKVTADEAIENIELIGINIIQDALKGDKQ